MLVAAEGVPTSSVLLRGEQLVSAAKGRALGRAGIAAVGGAAMTSVLGKLVARCRAHAAGCDASAASSGACTAGHNAEAWPAASGRGAASVASARPAWRITAKAEWTQDGDGMTIRPGARSWQGEARCGAVSRQSAAAPTAPVRGAPVTRRRRMCGPPGDVTGGLLPHSVGRLATTHWRATVASS